MIHGTQVKMARVGIGLTVRELASLAKISPNTVTRIESGQPSIVSTLEALERALTAAGATFSDNGGVVISKEAVDARKARG